MNTEYYTRLIQSAALRQTIQAQMRSDPEFQKIAIRLLSKTSKKELTPQEFWKQFREELKKSLTK